jgi:hypothetical protein
MSKFVSRGIVHHVDSTVTCPDCGRRFRTGTVIAEGRDTTRPGERMVVASFRSKQEERAGPVGADPSAGRVGRVDGRARPGVGQGERALRDSDRIGHVGRRASSRC